MVPSVLKSIQIESRVVLSGETEDPGAKVSSCYGFY